MKNPLTYHLLPWLLHHANREGKDEHFYAIKNRLLKKYGKHICYDVQFLEGVKCTSCHGTGIHHYYDFNGNVRDTDFCWHCYGGWYKRPTWVTLARIQFGRYEFHQPFSRQYEKPDNSIPIIEGYIDHDRSKYGKSAKFFLFLLYEKGFLERWYKGTGIGWRVCWWQPRNYANNVIHLIKHGRRSIPFMRNSWVRATPTTCYSIPDEGDLPF